MANSWEPASVKAQFRLASLKLGQLQESKDSQGPVARREIVTFLESHNIAAARIKAQKLIQDDSLGDVLERLGMHLGFLLEHLNEIEPTASLSPNLVEAVSTIIFVAPHVDCEDLRIVKDLLTRRLGEEFAQNALRNDDNRIAATIVQATTGPPPSASAINTRLRKIAGDCGIKWSPEPLRGEILDTLSEIIDPQGSLVVDLPRLRTLCCSGLPDEPRWLRPRIWKLFLGTLPALKSSWKGENRKQRESYYDFIRQLLGPFSNLPPPSKTLAHLDSTLLNVSEQLSNVPFPLFQNDLKEPGATGPLSAGAADSDKIPSAQNLDVRLTVLQGEKSRPSLPSRTPDIRINNVPKLILPSTIPEIKEPYDHPPNDDPVHEEHWSALLRLLYVHNHINPGNISPHISSLLVVLYGVLNQENEPEDLAHVEADTFWLFEAIVGEFAELEDDEGGNVWMKKFSERLAWADAELSDNLRAKGLDPALPHYSYQWLAPLLTRTLPVASVIVVWDAIFSRPMRERNMNPKLDCLLDVGCAMLMRTRATLFSLGGPGPKSPGFWARNENTISSPKPLPAWQLQQAFLEGVSLLQRYPVDRVGGIDRILQTASDLNYKRGTEKAHNKGDSLRLGARLKVTVWKGFTNQQSSPDLSPEASDEETPPETSPVNQNGGADNQTSVPPASGWAASMWRGITNQSSMDVPSTPTSLEPTSPEPSSPPTPVDPFFQTTEETPPKEKNETTSPKGPVPSLWGYAEKLKDSDAVATMAKVGTNWRAKTLLVSWGRPNPIPSNPSPSGSPTLHNAALREKESKMETWSLPGNNDSYSPPPRPAYFRPPRDSFIFPTNVTSPTSTLEQSAQHEGGIMENVQSSLASLTRAKIAATPGKSVPRPLLLGSSTSITSPPGRPLSRAGGTPTSDRGEWADVLKLKGQGMHTSQSSVSSLSPSDAFRALDRKEYDSDSTGTSRRIPLNRKSISPMAIVSRMHQGRTMSSSSATSSGGLLSPPLSSSSEKRGWSPLRTSESPRLMTSPSGLLDDSIVLSTDDETLDSKKSSRTTTPSLSPLDKPSASPLPRSPSRSPRLRSKRYNIRPPTLDIQDIDATRQQPVVERRPNPNSLDVEWPSDDQDVILTPKALNFGGDQISDSTPPKLTRSTRRTRKSSWETLRKNSGEGSDARLRGPSKMRKYSNDSQQPKKTGESSAEEGDDEGYDDLLSAYESESSRASLDK